MPKLNSCFEDFISPNLDLMKIVINSKDPEQITHLNTAISNLDNHYKFVLNIKKTLQKSKININHKESTKTPVLDEIKGIKNSSHYVKLPLEVEDYFGGVIRSKSHLEKIENQLDEGIQLILNFRDQAICLKHIYSSLKKSIPQKKIKDYPYSNFLDLEKYISKKSLAIKCKIKSNDYELLRSPKTQTQPVVTEFTQIKNQINELLSLEQNCDKIEMISDTVKHLIDIFGLKSIREFQVNAKCKIMINIGDKDYLLADIFDKCKRIEGQVTPILNQAEIMNLLIENCFENKDFVATHKKNYSSKIKCSIRTLVSKTNKYFNTIDHRISLKSPSILYSSIGAVENDTDFNYFQFILKQTEIILSANQEKNQLSINTIKALIEICGASIQDIGLDKYSHYVFYFNKSYKFMTLDDVIKKLSRVDKKAKLCISRTTLLLGMGLRSLQFPQLLINTKQSYLTPQNIESYLNTYQYRLNNTKLDLETSSAEVAEKTSAFTSVYTELIEVNKHIKYIYNSVYTTDTQQRDTTITNKKTDSNSDNSSELFQSVDEIVVKNNGSREIKLYFVFSNQYETYIALRQRCQRLKNSIDALITKAERIKNDNEKFLQTKIEQSSQQKSQSVANKTSKSLYIELLTFGISIGMLSLPFILDKTYSTQLQQLLKQYGNFHTLVSGQSQTEQELQE